MEIRKTTDYTDDTDLFCLICEIRVIRGFLIHA